MYVHARTCIHTYSTGGSYTQLHLRVWSENLWGAEWKAGKEKKTDVYNTLPKFVNMIVFPFFCCIYGVGVRDCVCTQQVYDSR